ncbi:MAG: S49 family peptidase, partial [Muribaculaceae bacterium]|nr:S49 family peptidase [Muribaculaceae bacterium]
LINNKLGIHFSFVESNPNAAFPSVVRPLTPQQHAAMQKGVDEIYALFTQRVADGRHMPVDSVRSIAEGRVWVGKSALRLGLLDEIGDLNQATKRLTAEVGLDEDRVVAYPKNEEELWATILRESKALEAARMSAGYSPLERRAMKVAERLLSQNHLQARMPAVIIK